MRTSLTQNEDQEREQRRKAAERFRDWRKTREPEDVTVEEFMAWRHEGHRY